nr:B-box zinc finger protein 20 [Ipomoea batatas]
MKIQCDACHNHEASFYCVADEAALCSACDHRVHHANKLASKHQRFSLLHPSAKQGPLCDICQNSRIQPAVIPPPAVVSPAIHNPLSKPTNKPPISSTVQEVTAAIKGTGNGQLMNGGGNGCSTTSSILEYLEMLPWYHVEELLDSSHGLCKLMKERMQSMLDPENDVGSGDT